jgi:hypothetical protein
LWLRPRHTAPTQRPSPGKGGLTRRRCLFGVIDMRQNRRRPLRTGRSHCAEMVFAKWFEVTQAQIHFTKVKYKKHIRSPVSFSVFL